MRKAVFSGAIAAVIFFVSGLFAAEINQGAKDLVIPAGNQGDVHLPHLKHQETLKDCMLCHVLYPQQSGAIQDLKQKGTLTQKQVMITQCIKCHKAKKDAGEESGPVSCRQCHIKS